MCILFASRVKHAAVIFLYSIDKAKEAVDHGVTISGEFIPVLPLSLPSIRVTLAIVPPFMSNEVLTHAFVLLQKIGVTNKENSDQ